MLKKIIIKNKNLDSFFIKLNELLFIFLNIYKIYIENDHQLF